MHSFKKSVVGLAFVLGTALVYQVSGFAAEAVTTVPDQKVEQKVEKKHIKKSVSIKKKHHKKSAEPAAGASPASNEPDGLKKS